MHQLQNLFGLIVIFEVEIGINQVQKKGKKVHHAVSISFVATDVISHQKALFSLNKIVYLKVENSQVDEGIRILLNFFTLLELVESLTISTNRLVPHSALIEAASQLVKDGALISDYNMGVLFELFDDLAVVGGSPFILSFGLLAMSHEKTPFGLCPRIDETIFFLVVIEKVFQIIDLIQFNQAQSLIQMFLYQKPSIAIIVLARTIRRMSRVQLNIIYFEQIVFVGNLIVDGVLQLELSFKRFRISHLWSCVGLNEAIDFELLKLSLILFVGLRICFVFHSAFVFFQREFLLALEVGTEYTIRHIEVVFFSSFYVIYYKIFIEVHAFFTFLALLDLCVGQLIHFMGRHFF